MLLALLARPLNLMSECCKIATEQINSSVAVNSLDYMALSPTAPRGCRALVALQAQVMAGL